MALYVIPKFQEKFRVHVEDDLISIDGLKDLSEKMDKLTKLLEIPADEYNDRRAACAEVRDLLRKYYPDCLLLMFGSSVNGFGVKNCDLDLLFLPFPGYCNLDFTESEKTPIPDPASILTGETSKDVLTKFDEWSHLKFIRTVLRHDKTHVKKVRFIPAKCPTLKIYLSNRKIVCDLSTSNRLVVFNSELLHFFETLDVRVKPLVMTLRFWAQKIGFIKKSFFSSYAFTILVISFLQNVSPPVLPSVQHLIELSGFSRMTAGWQTAFTTNENLIEKSRNTKTISELLIQFFEYYWNFDYVQNIVCPYSGKPLPVKDLKSSQDERMSEFEISSINIQDPFILSRNICKIEGSRTVFKLALLTASVMLQENNDNFKFSMLFDPSEYQKTLDFHYYMIGNPKVCFISLNYECAARLKQITKTSHLWFEKATQAVFDILQYGLLMECEVTDKRCWEEKITPAYRNDGTGGPYKPSTSLLNNKQSFQNTPHGLELLLSIQCILYCRTWIGRKNVTEFTLTEDELGEFNNTVIKSEYTVSRELVKKNPLLNSPVPLLCFRCYCYKHISSQISDIVVMLRPLTLSKEFYQVSVFLAAYIPRTVKKILSSD